MATEYYILTIGGTVDLSEQTTSLYFKTDDAVADDTLVSGDDLIAAWMTSVEADWLAAMSQQYEIRRYTARRVTPLGSAVAHLEFERGAKPGDVADDISPLNLAPAVRIIPGTLGSTGGRCFLPSPFRTAIDNNTYHATYSGLIVNIFDRLLTAISDTYDWTWQVHHAKTQTFSAAVGWNLSPRFGFQGRRRYPIS
jgi:hypothetical protein